MQGVAETLIMTGYKLVGLTAGLLPVVVVLPRPSSFQTREGERFHEVGNAAGCSECSIQT